MSKKPKQEPVAWMYVNLDGECEQIVYGTPPTDDDSITPLYAAPSAAAAISSALAAPRPEPVLDGQSGHPVMLPRAPVPVLGLISDEVRAALKAADAVESQEAYRTRAVAPDETEALRRDAERLRGLLAEAQKAVWMNYDGELLDRIEAALKEVPR